MGLGSGEWVVVEGRVSLVGAGAGGVLAVVVVVVAGVSHGGARVGSRVQVWTPGCGTMTRTTTTCSAGDGAGARI